MKDLTLYQSFISTNIHYNIHSRISFFEIFIYLDAYLKDHVVYKWKNKNIKMISKEMAQYTVLGSKTQRRYSTLFEELGKVNMLSSIWKTAVLVPVDTRRSRGRSLFDVFDQFLNKILFFFFQERKNIRHWANQERNLPHKEC